MAEEVNYTLAINKENFDDNLAQAHEDILWDAWVKVSQKNRRQCLFELIDFINKKRKIETKISLYLS